MGEGFGNHLIETPLVNTDILATRAADLIINHDGVLKPLNNARLMTPQNGTGPDFIIFPEFLFAGGTLNGQHPFFLHPMGLNNPGSSRFQLLLLQLAINTKLLVGIVEKVIVDIVSKILKGAISCFIQ